MAHLKHTTWHRQRGLTLVELMVTIAVVAILATTAVSTMSNMRAKQQVVEAASAIAAKVQRAKSLARAKSEDIQLIVSTSAVTIQDKATTPNVLDTLDFSNQYPDVTVSASRGTFGLSYLRGTMSSGNVTVVSNTADYSARIVITGQGRIRFCSDDGLENYYGKVCT